MLTTTSAQLDALRALDRATKVRAWLADSENRLHNLSDLFGHDFFDQAVITEDADNPIGQTTIKLRAKVGGYSLAPLDEDSAINRTSAGSYAPFLNPNRSIMVEVATMLRHETPTWVTYLWDGIIDDVELVENGHGVILTARDPMSRLNDTFIETVAEYGDDAGTVDVEDVMQQILDANGLSSYTLAYTATAFPVRAYDLGNVTVLDALLALRDQIGWNLSWKWNAAAGRRKLTLWEPARSSTASLHTFGPDDYFVIPRVGLSLSGVRNAIETVYTDADDVQQTASATRPISIAAYRRRFMRIDARGTSILTSTQADNLNESILDDTEAPPVQQEIECPFFWPIELGDLYTFSPNRHYSTEQKWAVFGYRHILSNDGPKRTIMTVAGKASGGYQRWHRIEDTSLPDGTEAGEILHINSEARVHTGDTAATALATVTLPPLWGPSGALNAVRCRGVFSSTGVGGTKDVAILYDGVGAFGVTLATGNQTTRMDLTFQALGPSTLNIVNNLASAWPTSAFSSPVDVNLAQAITFTVDLASAGDTATLEMSEVIWLGPASD